MRRHFLLPMFTPIKNTFGIQKNAGLIESMFNTSLKVLNMRLAPSLISTYIYRFIKYDHKDGIEQYMFLYSQRAQPASGFMFLDSFIILSSVQQAAGLLFCNCLLPYLEYHQYYISKTHPLQRNMNMENNLWFMNLILAEFSFLFKGRYSFKMLLFLFVTFLCSPLRDFHSLILYVMLY